MIDQKPRYAQTSFIADPVMELMQSVVLRGTPIESRYGPCIELIGGRLEVPAGTLVTRPRINPALGWMELLQLVAGVFDLRALKTVAPYADHSLFTPQMAYGPRIQGRILDVFQSLLSDPWTRQAVLFIGQPSDGPSSNLPCTLTIQFLLRESILHAVVSMRSWDLCRGLPYDLMMFSGLLQIVARCLKMSAGNVIVHAGSAHIYDDQTAKVPHISDKRWIFSDDAPDSWHGFVSWANVNIPLLRQGGTPSNILYVSV